MLGMKGSEKLWWSRRGDGVEVVMKKVLCEKVVELRSKL